MKSRSRVSLILCCALMQCAAYVFISEPSAQASVAALTTETNNRSSDEERTTLPSRNKNRKDVTASHGPARREHLTGKITLPAHASIVKTHGSNAARNNSYGLKTRSQVADPQRTSIKRMNAAKAGANRTLPAQRLANSAIDGGNFRNRHLTPVPGIIGGSATTRENTARLSGTNMGRKHLN